MSFRSLVFSFALSSALVGAFVSIAVGQQNQRPEPMEDRRPPLFIRETFPMPEMAEIYFSQVNIGSPNVELNIYGQTKAKWMGMTHEEARATGNHGGLEMVWRPSPKDDPTYVYFGPCFTPCAFTLKDTNNFVDLTDLAKVKWRTKQSGFHNMQAIIKLADGSWYIGDYMEPPSRDWLEREFSFIDMRWKEFDPETVVTTGTGNFVDTPDLSRVDEVGVTSLATGNADSGGHGASSAARIDWIEIYGRPVPR